MQTTRTRTAVRAIGVPLLLVGIWGGLVPFVGPLFDFSMGGGTAWTWTESRATLHLVPAIATVVGSLLLLGAHYRRRRIFGAGLATLAGAWFVVGPVLRPLWAARSGHGMVMGTSPLRSALEDLGYHYGTGVIIVALAAFALGLLMVEVRAPSLAEDFSHRTETADDQSVLVDA